MVLECIPKITLSQTFIICNCIIICILIISWLLCKTIFYKYKIKTFSNIFCEFENIPKDESKTDKDVKHISPRLMGQIDKEVFKAYANAMADM